MKKVLLLLPRGFELVEAAAFIDVFGWNALYGVGKIEICTCGIQKEVPGSFGQKLMTNTTLDQIVVDEFEALVLPGGFEEFGFYEEAMGSRVIDLIKTFHEQNRWIATVCTGALPAAESGILKGQPATTHNTKKRQQFLAERGAVLSRERVVKANRLITSSGPGTALSVALLLLEQLTDNRNAEKIKKLMLVE